MERVESALRHLIIKERTAIAAAVRKSYGDDWTFAKALFATTKAPRDSSEEGNDEPDFVPAARVMGWIMEGMPSL